MGRAGRLVLLREALLWRLALVYWRGSDRVVWHRGWLGGRSVLLESRECAIRGVVTSLFNAFNVLLDFDAGTATIEGELDPDVEIAISLSEFRRELES